MTEFLEPRRAWLRRVLWLLAFPVVWVGARLGHARWRRDLPRHVTLPIPTTDGVTFHSDVIFVQEQGTLTALSVRCPHLGCRINRVDGAELVCPCHGSRFSLTGQRLTGPAAKDLDKLPTSPSEPGTVDVKLNG